MSLGAIDLLIAEEIGRLCWDLLPDVHHGLERAEDDPAFREIWDYRVAADIHAVRKEDPYVQYPAIYLNSEAEPGAGPAIFVYPPAYGTAVRLSEYLSVLKRFLIPQLTTHNRAHVPLVISALRELASELSTQELLRFVDQLWRGRWIVDAHDWADLRLHLIGEGTEGRIDGLLNDTARLQMEALKVVEQERQLKATALSMDEWLYESYCLLPEVLTWLQALRRAAQLQQDDELEKYDRVLDEFQADMLTTLMIPSLTIRGGKSLAEEYLLGPLTTSKTAEAAVAQIRALQRGRSIIPRVWFDQASRLIANAAVEAASPKHQSVAIDAHTVERIRKSREFSELNRVDLAANFGHNVTASSHEARWIFLMGLFDYYGDE